MSKETTGPPTGPNHPRSFDEVKTDKVCEKKIEDVISASGLVEQCVHVCTITKTTYEKGVPKETQVDTTVGQCPE